MKKLSLLVSLLVFIFIASVSSSYAQTTEKKKTTTEKTTIITKKAVSDDKAPCPKTANKPHDCAHKRPGNKCAGARKAPCPKTSAVKSDARKSEDAVIEEKDKTK